MHTIPTPTLYLFERARFVLFEQPFHALLTLPTGTQYDVTGLRALQHRDDTYYHGRAVAKSPKRRHIDTVHDTRFSLDGIAEDLAEHFATRPFELTLFPYPKLPNYPDIAVPDYIGPLLTSEGLWIICAIKQHSASGRLLTGYVSAY